MENNYHVIKLSDFKVPAFLWTTDIEANAMKQIENLCHLPYAFHHVAIMSDVHSGYGMPIGGVLATEGVVVPNAVGYDGGCGVFAIRTTMRVDALGDGQIKEIIEKIDSLIPTGVGVQHGEKQDWTGFDTAPGILVVRKNLDKAKFQLGTLGAGNHFSEIQAGDDGYIWLMLHSGSRKFGHSIATEYHNKAVELCKRWHSDLPNMDLAFLPLDTPEGKEYMEVLRFVLEYATENRARMMEVMKSATHDVLGCDFQDEINVHHNYANIEHHFGRNVVVHRKGAVFARKGDRVAIPGDMGTFSYIGESLGNPFSFNTMSHGAGRVMGRNDASRTLSVEECRKDMEGIEFAGFKKKTKYKKGKLIELDEYDLGESCRAYKDIDEVMRNQSDLVKPVVKLKPLGVVKG